MSKTRKILVLASHPDDEVLGVGATIKKLSELGAEVHVAIVASARKTNGKYNRELTWQLKRQTEDVQKILGIHAYHFLDLGDEELHEHFGDVRRSVERLRDEIKPDVIFVHNPTDINQDHRTVYEAARIAFRVAGYRKNFELLTYEVLSSTDQGYAPFDPNLWVWVSHYHVQAKAEAMHQYTSEVTTARSGAAIEALATVRGAQSGFDNAEAFRVVLAKQPTNW